MSVPVALPAGASRFVWLVVTYSFAYVDRSNYSIGAAVA